jgi:STE24 endopeptidase
VSGLSRIRVAAPLLGALAAAEVGVRLLAPREHRRALAPAPADEHFSAAEIARGRRYARGQAAIGLLGGACELGVVGWLCARVRRAPRPASSRPAVGAAAGAGLALAGTLAGLPAAALARRRAIAVGLITQSWRAWGLDLLRAGAIETAFAAGAGAGTVALTRRWPRGWWLPAAGISIVLGAGLSALAPVVLDPIFNDYDPLPDGRARADVLALAEAAGVRVGQVLSVDASRRTTAANAYVAGLGPTKRVVLFDTLLRRADPDELRVVVAHELAHVRFRDVLRGIGFAALAAPASTLAVQRCSWELAPRQAGTAGALPALALSAALVTAPLGALASRLSRALERRADRFALELTGAPAAFVAFERRLALQNVADLRPPRWRRWLASHPPTLERIAMALGPA